MSAQEEFESEENYTDFVPAVFARSPQEAEMYRELLEDHDIPAVVGADEEDLDKAKDKDEPVEEEGKKKKTRPHSMSHGVPVLVPEALLDEASEVIADREDLADFEEDELEEDEDEDDEEGQEYGLAATADGEAADDEDEDEGSSFLLGDGEEDEDEGEKGDGLFGDDDELAAPDDDEEF
jgi:hypothetical protein